MNTDPRLQEAAIAGSIHWHQHALERLLERGITRQEVITCVQNGEVIEQYEADKPLPSCLIFHRQEQPLHVVAALDAEYGVCHVITAYRPDSAHFGNDLRTRRK